ncbi:Uncharacterized protein OS=Pedosphaera parvula (strain Ellin514) GN=Cflav_PD4002 PE=4 SV=1: DUF2971 [Gemmataceae bacterium]|jgi:hypothetical protein|nr:Uncharacterized protein OS=Pedosphaera parvula (strain Ellin514) GN=Cflav_PD4002 PE=4 SV=1: DUF2971 [Gemmataceae bacterium]VTT97583.1 Uncharacterized protein OS=Pedosphaera parvula (strain Ellin514) GN=Cflav_PD4002 PE=4 SV=1: DUF2971 [Gemmataceae bacterium]
MDVLYKYLPPARIDVLERRTMRLSQPPALNDPHDALVAIRSRLEEQRGDAPVLADDFKVERYYAQRFREDLAQQLGVLCFAADPHIHLMWSHYCLNHTGYVLHIDPLHSFFDRELVLSLPPFWLEKRFDGVPHPSSVTYSSARPMYYMEDGVPLDVLFQKSEHWGYEREYRSLMNLRDGKLIETTKHDKWPVYLLDLPPGLIVGATLGLDATTETTDRVTAACKGAGVPVYKIVADHLTYDLRSVPLTAL